MWESLNRAASYVGNIVVPIEDENDEPQPEEAEEEEGGRSEKDEETQQLRRDNQQLQQRIQDMERQFLHNNAALRQLLDGRQQELQEARARIASLETQLGSRENAAQPAEVPHEPLHAVSQARDARILDEANGMVPAAAVDDQAQELRQKISSLEDELASQRQQSEERKAQVTTAQEEARRLREVINQLRSASKQNTTEMDFLRKENEEMKAQLQNQLRAAEEQHYQLSQGTVDASIVEQAYEQLADAFERIEQLEAALSDRTTALQACEAELESARRQYETDLAVVRKQREDEFSSVRATEADFELVQADLRDREAQLANLQAALAQLEHDTVQEAEHMRAQFERQLAEQKRSHQIELQATKADAARRANDQLQALEQELQEAKIEISKMQAMQRQQTHENQNLRAALDKAVTSLQRPQEDVVDRELVSNLIVSYFQRRRSKEVLELIARILNLNDDQLMAIGLKQDSGLLSAIIAPFAESSVTSGAPPSTAAPDVEASSLSELWVKFLMHEANPEGHS